MKSTPPDAAALRGMLSNAELSAACAKVKPPASLMALSPTVPSLPLPERMTPMAFSAVNGGEPVNKWYQVAPSEYRSLRASSGFPSACSGAM